jgi:hypothetical protein
LHATRGYESKAALMTKRVLAAAAVAIGLCALWSTLVVTWALRAALTPIAPHGDASGFMAAAVERVKGAGIGNCTLAMIEDGRIFDSYFYSVGDPIDASTLFQWPRSANGSRRGGSWHSCSKGGSNWTCRCRAI